MAFDNEKMNQMFLRLYLGVEAFKNICNEYQCQSCPIPHQLCGNMATPDLDNVKSAWGAVCNKSDDEIDALLHQATEDAPVIEQNDAETVFANNIRPAKFQFIIANVSNSVGIVLTFLGMYVEYMDVEWLFSPRTNELISWDRVIIWKPAVMAWQMFMERDKNLRK